MTKQVYLSKDKLRQLAERCEECIEECKKVVANSMKQQDKYGAPISKAYAYLIRSTTRKDMACIRVISDLVVGIYRFLPEEAHIQISPLGLRGINRLLFRAGGK